LVKEGGRYELFHVRGFINYGRLIKTVQKNIFFGRALDVAPIGFYIIQNGIKMRKI
jgi:hypothetical protein